MVLNVVIPWLEHDDPESITKCRKCVQNQWSKNIEIKIIEETGDSYPDIFNRAIDRLTEGFVLFLFPWVYLKDRVIDDQRVFGYLKEGTDLAIFSYESFCWNIPSNVELLEKKLPLREFALEMHEHPGDITYSAIWNKILSVDIIKNNNIIFDTGLSEEYQNAFLLEYLAYCRRIVFSKVMLACFYTQPEADITETERIKEKQAVLNLYGQLLGRCMDSEQERRIIDNEVLGYYKYEKVKLMLDPVPDKHVADLLLEDIRREIG